MVSKSQLKKISARVRKGQHDHQDMIILTQYRDSFLPVLAETILKAQQVLSDVSFGLLVSGRPKRIKSIVRKISRGDVDNVATVADLAGVRIIIQGKSEQADVLERITKNFDIATIKDYRERPESGYRACHIYVISAGRKVEVQLRTLPQQLWANESESLGEHVKHGGGLAQQRKYLDLLSTACTDIDNGRSFGSLDEIPGIGEERGPIQGRLPVLMRQFASVVLANESQRSYILVYDGLTNELLSIRPYPPDSIKLAAEDFNYKAQLLDENRYDVLLLNAKSEDALRVTHPRYFPSI